MSECCTQKNCRQPALGRFRQKPNQNSKKNRKRHSYATISIAFFRHSIALSPQHSFIHSFIMMDDSENNSGNDDNNGAPSSNATQCFAPVQSRKIWSPLVSSGSCLCPSMDIVALTTLSNVVLHRTVSWQKLATLSNASDFQNKTVTQVCWSPDGRALAIALSDGTILLYHIEGMNNNNNNNADPLLEDDGTSPNGRIHAIDDLQTTKSSDDEEDMEQQYDHNTNGGNVVRALTWAHVGRPHAKWNFSEKEFEMEESWRYRSQYLDKSAMFLPPTSYQMEEEELNEGESSIKNTLPFCCTPLSLLCVATATQGIHLYLHGRYPIATLEYPPNYDDNDDSRHPTGSEIQIVPSFDLTHLVVAQSTTTTTKLVLYNLPALKQHRYHLQSIASLYCSISSHLVALQQHAKQLVASWKSSLKPLDMKLDGLTRLLKSYGVAQDSRTVLFQFLMVGHTSISTEATNALDQFFTGVQMNDQLIQRLERSLHGAVGNVESLARKGVLAPARALVYDAGEMRGQSRAFSSTTATTNFGGAGGDTNGTTKDMDTATCQLYQSCEILVITVERMIAQLVEARFRLRDLVSWLRSVGSQIKARGTAANSAHRENARKRRVPQVVIQRIATYLQPLTSLSGVTTGSGSITEHLLNVPLSDFFVDHPTFVVLERPSSPRSAVLLEDNTTTLTAHPPQKSPTISYAVSRVSDFCQKVFEQPRMAVSKSVSQTTIVLQDEHQTCGNKITAAEAVGIHTRIGLDILKNNNPSGNNHNDDDPEDNISSSSKGFFQPRIWDADILQPRESSLSSHYSCSRQWTIMAQRVGNTSEGIEYVQLFVFPMGNHDKRSTPENDDDGRTQEMTPFSSRPSYYLKTRIELPSDCQVKEIGFYGDDGKSSLSSGADSGSGEEGRQGMGLLIDRREQNDNSMAVILSEELWLLSYDDLVFQPSDINMMESHSPPASTSTTLDEKNHLQDIILDPSVAEECTVRVKPLCDDDSEEEEYEEESTPQNDGFVVYAKTRQLRLHDTADSQSEKQQGVVADEIGAVSSRRLMLSGSRGIGGVFTSSFGNGSTLIDLLDLEEDEEGSDEEDEEEEEGSMNDE